MKIFYIFFFSFFLIPFTFSQAPEIEWQNTIGGDLSDNLDAMQQTADGGFILAGSSYSNISGDKTENNYGLSSTSDGWIVKVDQFGNIEWQNTIGSTGTQAFSSVDQLNDGGYILGGISGSVGFGYYLVRTNSIGDVLWVKNYSGGVSEILTSLENTSDGGFILGGYSSSGMGLNKTEPSQGGIDYWVIKTDSAGMIIWQNTIGGSMNDYLYSTIQTSDGGYLLGGYSNSTISGDKSEIVLGGGEYYDFWAVKLDALGNIIWQKTIGGNGNDYLYDLIQVSDGGYILAGYSGSGISFDKTEPANGGDYWVVKLDSLGDIEWENSIGGVLMDYLKKVRETIDGGFILGGYSQSFISGDKTQGNWGGFPPNDYWVVKIDNTGLIEWDKTIGGANADYLRTMSVTSDGGVALGGSSNSPLSGDKTEGTIGGLPLVDMWVVKLYPDCTPSPELCNSLDDNCNGLIDDGITETISISAGGPITFCQGGNVLLTATYSGATVQWKKNGVNIPGAASSTYLVNIKGTYTCVTNSPCGTALSAPIMVNVIKNPPASIIAAGATTFCAGGSVILTANAGGGLSYQWYKGASLIAGATSINYTATMAGNYKCRVTKTATGCFKNSNPINVSVPCKEGEIFGNEIQLYPNPANEQLFIQTGSTSNKNITILNEVGQHLTSLISSEELIMIIIVDYPQGMYFMEINDNGYISSKTFVKQ